MNQDFNPYREWLGIPASEQPCDYYRLLGLQRFEAREDVIVQAADERMSIVRQYQTGPKAPFTQGLLNELSAARICLLNAATKATYDAVLQGSASASPPVMTSPHAAQANAGTFRQIPTATPGGAIAEPPVSRDVVEPPPPPPSTVGQPPPVAEEPTRSRSSTLLVIVVAAVGVVTIAGLVGWAVAMREGNSRSDAAAHAASPLEVTDPAVVDDTPSDAPVLVLQEADGKLHLTPATALLYGEQLQLGTAGGDDVLTNWRSTDDWVEWRLKVSKPSVFQVMITYAADVSATTAKYHVSVAGANKAATVRRSEEMDFVTDELFIAITRSGEHALQVKAEGSFTSFIELKAIQLIPATSN